MPACALAGVHVSQLWERKVESRLLQLYRARSDGGPLAAQRFAVRHALPLQADGTLLLELRWPAGQSWQGRTPAWLHQTGARLVVQGWDRANVKVHLGQLPVLAANRGVQWLQLPLAPQAMGVQSQGVALAGLEPYHCQAKLGQGQAIAVVDVGFGGWEAAAAAGELPADVTVPADNGVDHGSNCAQIVADMAPKAQLFPAEVQSVAALQNWIGADLPLLPVGLVSHSLGWYGETFGDGSGWLCKAIADLRLAGVIWVTAAGNLGGGGLWRGPWRDDDGDGWLEFADATSANAFQGASSALAMAVLDWDGYPTTAIDVDLQLCRMVGEQCVPLAEATAPQTGSQPPVETLSYVLDQAGVYAWRIRHSGGPLPKQLRLSAVSPAVGPLKFHSKAGSLAHPADCAAAVAVGAVDQAYYATGPVASYSSQGPTADGRPKPELVAPAAVATWQSAAFQGTSAAVPHVAAAIAIYAQAAGLGLPEAASAVVALAVPLPGVPTPEFTMGNGRLFLPLQGSGADCQPGAIATCPSICGDQGSQACSSACEYGPCVATAGSCTDADAGGNGGDAQQVGDSLDATGDVTVATPPVRPAPDSNWCQSRPQPGRGKLAWLLLILAVSVLVRSRRGRPT